MMSVWRITGQPDSPALVDAVPRKVERVLVYYEGPQWLVLAAGTQRYVAYAADEDDDAQVVRWIEAPVSGVELRAFASGKMPLRDAIVKPSARVVDYTADRQRALRVWSVTPEQIPEDCLPDDEATLPRFARDPVADNVPAGRVSFECDGPSVRNSAMSFAALGAITSTVQKLWSALADALKLPASAVQDEWGASTLAFAGSRPGSFAIDVATENRDIFMRVAERYRDVVRASYRAPERFTSALSAYDVRVHHTYREYLKAIQSYRVDVFADWQNDGAFVGYECAGRAESVIATSQQAPIDLASPTTFTATGFFSGWMSDKRKFEFHNLLTGEEYIGSVHPKVSSMWMSRPPALGRTEKLYVALVRMTPRPGDKGPSYRLMRLSEQGVTPTLPGG